MAAKYSHSEPRLSVPGFEPEEAETFEIGMKSEWLDQSLRLNVAAFQTDYTNLQLIIQRGISPLTTNAASPKSKEWSWSCNGRRCRLC